MNDLELYDRVLKKHGIKAQLVMVMEECAELSKECSKIYRALDNGDTFTLDALSEEMADVQIVTGEVQRYFGLKDIVKLQRKGKLLRLAERLREYEKGEN